jgi:ATP-dependent RNA helicase SUPV3L1/SUV3
MPISFSSSGDRDLRARGHGVTAVLGPTNTGKTHLAIERMLAHSSGLIGLPLRLLAREVYNKIAQRAGADAVALITGEEKIKPASPRFWVSTVEAMPRDLDVAFVAVDEVQLGADLDRGHVFTDRMLNCRGREETLVLGAATVRPMVEKLLPGANILSRPRLSQLVYAGEKKITRQPRRTAIVAFSSDEVYAIAELIRRQRGGAAVVLGALSPRTRNAQVELYQSGDVDYLVATDAIGMGLNLDVNHVAFASDCKFDGYQFRRLTPAEFAQIAGRAGRATRDGSFGTTGRCAPFDAELVHALESHSFESVKVLQWRNSELDFASLGALSASLAMLPAHPSLTRAPIAEDIMVFEHAARDEEVRALATGSTAIARLWDVCQIPDYRKISPAAHAELVATLYGFLLREGRISDDWFARQVAQADHTDGDIDTLSTRIAHIRTWTFAANRPDWLGDPDHWQGVTRAIEDRLSDALHERLAERFVDRRTSVLMRRMRENTMLETEITKTGEVVVEGHTIGRLDGFRFAPEATSSGTDAKALSAAAQKALAGEIEARANKLAHAPDSQFVLTSDATIRWIGEPVAKIVAGDTVLRPRVRILADEQLTGAALEAAQVRLDLWTRTHIERLLAPLFILGAAEDITGLARGIAYQLVEALGVLERSKVADDLKSLDQALRAVLRRHGVRFGAYHVYVPLLLKPGPRALAAQLWGLKHGGPDIKGLDELQRLAASGRTSFPVDKEVQRSFYRTIGYRVCGERAVRVDILERLADLIRPALSWRPGSPSAPPAGAFEGNGFTVTQAMTSLTGSSGEDFASILRALGYRMEKRPKPVKAAAAEMPPGAAARASDQAASGQAVSELEPATVAASDQAASGLERAAIAASDQAASGLERAAIAASGQAVSGLEPAAVAASDQAVSELEPAPVAASDQAVSELEPAPVAASDQAASELEPIAASDSAPGDEIAADGERADDEAAPHDATPVLDAATTAQIAADQGADTAASGDGIAREAEAGAPDAPMAPAELSVDVPPAAAAEPELVEVWRPGGRGEEWRGQRRSPQRQRARLAGNATAERAVTAEGKGDPAVAAVTSTANKLHRRPRGPGGEFGALRDEAGERRSKDHRGDHRSERQGDRAERARGERPHFVKARNEHKERRDYAPHREREKQADPNSPFAKLAALKAQLEANAKERR